MGSRLHESQLTLANTNVFVLKLPGLFALLKQIENPSEEGLALLTFNYG
jgi:hypothetical protein